MQWGGEKFRQTHLKPAQNLSLMLDLGDACILWETRLAIRFAPRSWVCGQWGGGDSTIRGGQPSSSKMGAGSLGLAGLAPVVKASS